MTDTARFSFPTDIRFGARARAELADFAETHCVSRPLLVTDSGLVDTAAFALVEDAMRGTWPGGRETFCGVHPNPVEADVDEARQAYLDGRCDSVIGVGGGSALDVAKVVRARLALPEVPLEEMTSELLPRRLAPFCAIPTTAGTGSEVGRSSVITVPALGRKVVIGGQALLADMAILDPELTVGLPPGLTAATGMDAMTHAIESYVCPMFHPMCDAIALEAVRLVRDALPRAYAEGADLEARGRMQLAATMGAVAFQKDLGVAHSLAHPLSTDFGIHHGLANAVVLPATIRFNGEKGTARYSRIVQALAFDPGDDPAEQVASWLESFCSSLQLTQQLRDLDVPREALPGLAAEALEDGCHRTNPRSCTEADLLRLYEEAW